MPEITRESVLESMESAADRMGLDLEDLQEMIIEVIDDCTTKAHRLKESIASSDSASVKAIAHDIKGSSANYGLRTASEMALQIEKNNDSATVEMVEELIKQFEILATFNLDQ